MDGFVLEEEEENKDDIHRLHVIINVIMHCFTDDDSFLGLKYASVDMRMAADL